MGLLTKQIESICINKKKYNNEWIINESGLQFIQIIHIHLNSTLLLLLTTHFKKYRYSIINIVKQSHYFIDFYF